MRNLCFTLLEIDDSLTPPTESNKIDANQLINITFVASTTDDDFVGTVQFQMSNDPCPYGYVSASFEPQNWVNIEGAVASLTGGAPGTAQVPTLCARWVRVVVTPDDPSTGTGTLTVNINALSI